MQGNRLWAVLDAGLFCAYTSCSQSSAIAGPLVIRPLYLESLKLKCLTAQGTTAMYVELQKQHSVTRRTDKVNSSG